MVTIDGMVFSVKLDNLNAIATIVVRCRGTRSFDYSWSIIWAKTLDNLEKT